MDTSILSNPAPSNGYNAVLGAMAAQAAPAEGTLGGFNASVHNRVKQTFINPVATYPFLVKPWRHRWELGFHEGDLMFIYHGKDGGTNSSKMVVLANLPTLNHIMTLKAEGKDDVFEDYREPRNWSYIGVMRNSAVASNRIGGGLGRNSSARGGNQRPAERLINIDVRGSTRMFNYWEYAMPGQKLHLVWRRVRLGNHHLTNPNKPAKHAKPTAPRWRVNGNNTVSYYDEQGKTKGTPITESAYDELPKVDAEGYTEAADHERQHPQSPFLTSWQLLPYSGRASDYTTEPVWWNPQLIATHQMQRPIEVGFVFQGIGAGERSDQTMAIRKATQLAEARFKLPMIHCFVRV
jgi:hypothetical protein